MCGGDAQLPLLWRKSLFKVWSQKDWGPCLFIFFGYESKWIFYSKRLWVRQLLSCHYRNKSPTFRCGFQPTAAVKSNGQPTKRMKTAQGLPAYLRPGAHRLIIHPWTWQINDVHCSTVELRGRARRAGRDNTSGLESSVKTKQFPQQIKYAQSVFPAICFLFGLSFMPISYLLVLLLRTNNCFKKNTTKHIVVSSHLQALRFCTCCCLTALSGCLLSDTTL